MSQQGPLEPGASGLRVPGSSSHASSPQYSQVSNEQLAQALHSISNRLARVAHLLDQTSTGVDLLLNTQRALDTAVYEPMTLALLAASHAAEHSGT
ncbi:hypothetical protein H696_03334 [Fonticula alba]|uniref:Uncharacterized protein n=1 Tax=Fonticula alba TaxID=691883 RepID=A0A058Z7G1_FONAL|nr:hypothetical protein H696_03334 [Fonticula alba]KCV69863.1 hypothetical protein H696_03334 [Fonticula alba]|eukprot:XP_009495469.1 hypothetical protein H696_03334 [Fonticula alba]